MFFTFIAVFVVGALIPYVVAPGVVNGVKAINTPPAAVSFDASPPAPAVGSNAAKQIVLDRRDSGSAD
jgi:hypothetical protein